MSKLQNTLSILGTVLALATLIAGVTHLDDRELGIGDYNEQASASPRLDDKELGIGDYNEQAYNSFRPDDEDLGISILIEQA